MSLKTLPIAKKINTVFKYQKFEKTASQKVRIILAFQVSKFEKRCFSKVRIILT